MSQPPCFSIGFAMAATARVSTARTKTFLASIFTVLGLEARAEAYLLLVWN